VRIVNFLLGIAEALASVRDWLDRARRIVASALPFLGPFGMPIAVLIYLFAFFPVLVILLSIPIFALVSIRRFSHWDDRLIDSLFVNISSSEHPEILANKQGLTECGLPSTPRAKGAPLRLRGLQFFKRYVAKKAGILAVFRMRLKHSQLYGDSEVVRDICSWLQGRIPDGALEYVTQDESDPVAFRNHAPGLADRAASAFARWATKYDSTYYSRRKDV
jgi:hypothetical protein